MQLRLANWKSFEDGEVAIIAEGNEFFLSTLTVTVCSLTLTHFFQQTGLMKDAKVVDIYIYY